ncbi:MAG: radical SAM peptide maturase [Muribaculaceae bacterium]|nr:radical SAM peptide maturase [Muribaculaceae bacterium]
MEIITVNNSTYIYDRISGYISLQPNSPLINEELCKPTDYAKKKYEYLCKFKLINCETELSPNLLSKKDLEDAILNTHQIIFEVTDKCNLNCFYCGYGHFYNNYDRREDNDFPFKRFLSIYNFFKNIWNKTSYTGSSYLRISFYGGEPLCNFDFIKQVVEFLKKNPLPNKIITYSMTTNAVLLNKYMDFLVENDFDILISLDGDRHNNSYRVFHNGLESFDIVTSNLDILQKKYPLFFSKRIKFNSVLHNRNSVVEATSFISKQYGKKPMTNELNIYGIAEGKIKEFQTIFHSKGKEFRKMSIENQKFLTNESPFLQHYKKWIFQSLLKTYSNDLHNVLSNDYYTDFISKARILPTNTCIPFSRKIFVSVTGKIYPCERIGNEIEFGDISDNGVNIDYEGILSFYNRILKNYIPLCRKCKAHDYCSVCVASDLKGDSECKKIEPRNIKEIINYFYENPIQLRTIMESLIVL